MRVTVVAVGTRMPDWVQQGVEEYAKRIRNELNFKLLEIPLASRSKSSQSEQYRAKEADAILARLKAEDFVVALEVKGRQLSTESLADRLRSFQAEGRNLSLLIGGPDGLHESCTQRADDCWSLAPLTLPHTIARITVVEQLYRAHTILRGHPYHRA